MSCAVSSLSVVAIASAQIQVEKVMETAVAGHRGGLEPGRGCCLGSDARRIQRGELRAVVDNVEANELPLANAFVGEQ